MPVHVFALMLSAVILAGGLTVLAMQMLSLPIAAISLATVAGAAALHLRRKP